MFFIVDLELEIDGIEDRTPYVYVALFTFVAFLAGLCCIGSCQIFVEKAFNNEDGGERRSYLSGVSKLAFQLICQFDYLNAFNIS